MLTIDFSFTKKPPMKFFLLVRILTIGILLLTSQFAISMTKDEPKPDPSNGFVPDYSEYDWIQLNTGEWLKGRLRQMFDESLEFYSEKLKTLTFDWDDICQIYSSQPNMVGINLKAGKRGKIILKDGVLSVLSKNKIVKINKSEVLSLAKDTKKRSISWGSKVNLGLNFNKGNKNLSDINTSVTLSRRTPDTRLNVSYLGNFSKAEGVETINDHRVNFNYDKYKSKRFFWRPFFGEYYVDPFSNIKKKSSIGAGAGYTFVDTKTLEWSIAAGPSYLKTIYDSVEIGDDNNETSAILALNSDIDWNINHEVEFIGLYQLQWGQKDNGGYSHHIVGTFQIDLSDYIKINLSTIWDFTQSIKTNQDGTVPKQNDLRLVIGFGLDL